MPVAPATPGNANPETPAPVEREVVVYVALDREFSEPILQLFEKETGIRVRAKYDTEATKSVGLATELLREGNRPRADVFWNNEPLNTVRLEKAGLLAPLSPSTAPTTAVGRLATTTGSAEGSVATGGSANSAFTSWREVGGRTRVILINTNLVADADRPRNLSDLADPKWKGKLGIAKPIFGMTATHMAALWSAWGPERTKAWLAGLKRNEVRILAGNRPAAQAVGEGRLALCLTDTDDADAEVKAGRPVVAIAAGSGPDDPGILIVPTTVARLAKAPRPVAAARLVEFLARPEVEAELVSRGGFLSLDPARPPPAGLPPGIAGAKRMPADFRRIERVWEESMEQLRAEFAGP